MRMEMRIQVFNQWLLSDALTLALRKAKALEVRMPKLRIESWSGERSWVDESHWSLDAFIYRLGLCTTLQGTDLKRAARSLRKKELFEINGIDIEAAGALIHTLESLGAKIAIIE